jgi:hypothetical protein
MAAEPTIMTTNPLSSFRCGHREQVRNLDAERGRDLVQRFQGGIRGANFYRADQCLTQARLVSEVILRPRSLQAKLSKIARKQSLGVCRISPPHPSG